MADIYNSISESGIIVPDTTSILSTIQQAWLEIFGGSLSLEEGTIQGRIIELLASERKACISSLAFVANQINPNVSTGVYLDAIGKLFGVERVGESYTVVSNVVLGGIEGTIIPAGSKAEDVDGNTYSLSNEVVIGATGSVFGTFVNDVAGAIPCLPNTLNVVSSSIVGWETVNNGGAGSLGALEESDVAYRKRIDISKPIYSTSMLDSLKAALYEINGLKSLYIYENYTSVAETHSTDPVAPQYIIPVGESVNPHSIFVFVQGGTNDSTFFQQVAEAMVKKRSGGCNMTASTVYPANAHTIVISNGSGIYNMTFNTPQPISIYMNLSVKNISYTGSDLVQDVKNVIANWFAGNIANSDFGGIGYSISAFDIGGVVSSQLGVVVRQCTIGLSAGSLSTAEIPIAINQIGAVDVNNIVVSTS